MARACIHLTLPHFMGSLLGLLTIIGLVWRTFRETNSFFKFLEKYAQCLKSQHDQKALVDVLRKFTFCRQTISPISFLLPRWRKKVVQHWHQVFFRSKFCTFVVESATDERRCAECRRLCGGSDSESVQNKTDNSSNPVSFEIEGEKRKRGRPKGSRNKNSCIADAVTVDAVAVDAVAVDTAIDKDVSTLVEIKREIIETEPLQNKEEVANVFLIYCFLWWSVVSCQLFVTSSTQMIFLKFQASRACKV